MPLTLDKSAAETVTKAAGALTLMRSSQVAGNGRAEDSAAPYTVKAASAPAPSNSTWSEVAADGGGGEAGDTPAADSTSAMAQPDSDTSQRALPSPQGTAPAEQ